jgi:hypothetical protein
MGLVPEQMEDKWFILGNVTHYISIAAGPVTAYVSHGSEMMVTYM